MAWEIAFSCPSPLMASVAFHGWLSAMRERDFTFNTEPSTHGRAGINKKRSRWMMESLESRQEPAALLCCLLCSGLFIFYFWALTVFVSFMWENAVKYSVQTYIYLFIVTMIWRWANYSCQPLTIKYLNCDKNEPPRIKIMVVVVLEIYFIIVFHCKYCGYFIVFPTCIQIFRYPQIIELF